MIRRISNANSRKSRQRPRDRLRSDKRQLMRRSVSRMKQKPRDFVMRLRNNDC